ncbi:chloride channel protein [Tomitella fengzijianii]|uniref:chloride channel protein n=1 Tax=Tomitella fengzijianii TaxID=2597660 RepID=UPI0018EF0DF9|nr:chloride channel protein [Tomitella fengzijianii]
MAGRGHPPRDLRHLADFTAHRRILLIAALAVPVGLLGACAAWVLLKLIGLITNLVFYQRVATELVAPGAGDHSPFLIIGAPVAGGLIVGLMARYGSEKIRGHGMPEAIESILLGGSKIQPRVAVLKPTSSAVAIGTGGPFGAEGPIIMTGGALGSLLAQFLQLTADERKTLLVAGSAAGMAATFNTPFAAIVLAVELLLFEWRPRSFIPVVAAVTVATLLRHVILGTGPLFPSTGDFHMSAAAWVLCAVTGVVSGLLAVVATTLVYASEDLFRKLPVHWMWWPAIGGVIIGIGGLFVPQALGVGYDVIGAELDGSIGLGLVVGILVVKTLIWSLSLGSGTSGGVLAPMFMIGGALGALEAQIFPDVGPGFWALVALAGVVGGVMRSPITGVVFAAELTHRFDALLPLVIGATAAYAVSVLTLKRSVLTEKIARRGFHVSREYDVDPLEILFVGEVMNSTIVTFAHDITVDDASATVSGNDPATRSDRRQMLYPVVDGQDNLVGVVTSGMLETAAYRGESDELLSELAVAPIVTHPEETLRSAAMSMTEHEVTKMPVVDRERPQRVLGIVTLPMLLAGRQKDLDEARTTERVLRIRVVRPRWLGGPDGSKSGGGDAGGGDAGGGGGGDRAAGAAMGAGSSD